MPLMVRMTKKHNGHQEFNELGKTFASPLKLNPTVPTEI